VNDLAAIVEDAIVEALERGVVFRRPLRVDLDWQELARLHGPFGSRFRVLVRNNDPTSGFEIQFVGDIRPAPAADDSAGAPFGVVLQ
jgi:hypothetical protein